MIFLVKAFAGMLGLMVGALHLIAAIGVRNGWATTELPYTTHGFYGVVCLTLGAIALPYTRDDR